jgi:hypothetical protein
MQREDVGFGGRLPMKPAMNGEEFGPSRLMHEPHQLRIESEFDPPRWTVPVLANEDVGDVWILYVFVGAHP